MVPSADQRQSRHHLHRPPETLPYAEPTSRHTTTNIDTSARADTTANIDTTARIDTTTRVEATGTIIPRGYLDRSYSVPATSSHSTSLPVTPVWWGSTVAATAPSGAKEEVTTTDTGPRGTALRTGPELLEPDYKRPLAGQSLVSVPVAVDDSLSRS